MAIWFFVLTFNSVPYTATCLVKTSMIYRWVYKRFVPVFPLFAPSRQFSGCNRRAIGWN